MKNFKKLSEEDILKTIGVSLRGFRIANNLTLEELAEKSEVNITTLSKIENGKTNSTILLLLRIFKALGREKEIEKLFPQPSPSPILMSKLNTKTSKPARRVRKLKKKPQNNNDEKWQWGDS